MKADEQNKRRMAGELAKEKAAKLEKELASLRREEELNKADEVQKEIEKCYKKAWCVPREFLAWQIRFCEENSIKVVFSAYEVDSQCFAIAKQLHDAGEVGIYVVPTSNDGDF
jgi:hypothetical protein